MESSDPSLKNYCLSLFRKHQRSSATPPPIAVKPNDANVQTIAHVGQWLQNLGFPQYTHTFVDNQIDGVVLPTLTSEELRDDLGVLNLRHRRQILDAIFLLSPDAHVERLPEHGRILDHLSNVRTYHSWIRVGVQCLGLAIVTLRLAPEFSPAALVSTAAVYFALVGLLALVYGIYRYKAVIAMIENSGPTSHEFSPDRFGVHAMLLLVLISSALSFSIIGVHST